MTWKAREQDPGKRKKKKNIKKGRNNKINNKYRAQKYSWNHTPNPIY